MAVTLLNNSSYKIKAGSVATTVGLVAEAGAIVFDESVGLFKICDGTQWNIMAQQPLILEEPVYDDLLGPLIGRNIDVASGRIDYNFFNGAVAFQANSRYPNEVVSIRSQITHRYKEGTNGDPHLHWKQQSANIPNWVMGWKLSENGEADIIEIDYSNYNLSPISSHAFPYTSGVLNQISIFPEIPMATAKISDVLSIVLFRDTGNTTGLFAGADPSVLVELATDADVHIEIDSMGSEFEYVK